MKELLGYLLIFLMTISFTYYTNKPINEDNLTFVEGKLVDDPHLGHFGGDMPRYYIEIKLLGVDNPFYIIDCAYSGSEQQQILSLKTGNNIKIGVKRALLKKNMVHVFTLYSYDQNKFYLTLDNYNYCHVNSWKILLPFIVITLFLIIFQILRPYFLNKKIPPTKF